MLNVFALHESLYAYCSNGFCIIIIFFFFFTFANTWHLFFICSFSQSTILVKDGTESKASTVPKVEITPPISIKSNNKKKKNKESRNTILVHGREYTQQFSMDSFVLPEHLQTLFYGFDKYMMIFSFFFFFCVLLVVIWPQRAFFTCSSFFGRKHFLFIFFFFVSSNFHVPYYCHHLHYSLPFKRALLCYR